jgi:hypothetical protein
VHLGTSHDAIKEKLKKYGLSCEKTLFLGLSRVHEMSPPSGSTNLDVFENSFNYFKVFGITNVIKSGDSFELNFENIFEKRKVKFRTKAEVLGDKNDIDQPAFAKVKKS